MSQTGRSSWGDENEDEECRGRPRRLKGLYLSSRLVRDFEVQDRAAKPVQIPFSFECPSGEGLVGLVQYCREIA